MRVRQLISTQDKDGRDLFELLVLSRDEIDRHFTPASVQRTLGCLCIHLWAHVTLEMSGVGLIERIPEALGGIVNTNISA